MCHVLIVMQRRPNLWFTMAGMYRYNRQRTVQVDVLSNDIHSCSMQARYLLPCTYCKTAHHRSESWRSGALHGGAAPNVLQLAAVLYLSVVLLNYSSLSDGDL